MEVCISDPLKINIDYFVLSLNIIILNLDKKNNSINIF